MKKNDIEEAYIKKKRNAYRVLAGKPEGKIQLGKSKSRWEDDIKMNIYKVRWQCVEWIHLAHGTSEQLL
jgi:hypothetical protein